MPANEILILIAFASTKRLRHVHANTVSPEPSRLIQDIRDTDKDSGQKLDSSACKIKV